jgi:hypothetical protein
MENATSSTSHSITRDVLVVYTKFLGASTNDEAFILSSIAMKVIDFIHLLKYGTHVNIVVSHLYRLILYFKLSFFIL